jgi:putative ABC transport system permease protein
MYTVLRDIRYALRQLRRSPGFLLTVVATLAIGIGLNAAIFAVVDAVLLRPLGYHDADRMVALRTHFDEEGRSIPRLGGDDYTDLAREVTGLEATARYEAYPNGFSIGGASFYAPVAQVSARFAEVLGVEPVAGRLFHPGDVQGTDALVGERFAREHFGSPAAAVGRTITYSGSVYTIVGVLPAGFSFPDKTQLWFEPALSISESRSSYNYNAIGRRRAGVSPANLSAQLAGFSKELQRTYPEDRHKGIEAVSLQEELTGSIRPTLHLLMGAASVILLIILANLTHLQLVKATRELRGLTIRAALGASRATLLTSALLQAAILASAGIVAAMALAVPALRLLVALAPADLPRLSEVSLNGDVLLFSGLTSLLVMAMTAVIPVWRVGRINPAFALRQDASRSTESSGRLRLRNSLVVAEIALTLTLSVAAVLLARQLIANSRSHLGFSPETLITLDTHAIVSMPAPILADNSPAAMQALTAGWDRIYEANLRRLDATIATLAAVPGVESVAAIGGAPMSTSGGSNVDYAIRGRQTFSPGATHLPHANVHPVTPGPSRPLASPSSLGVHCSLPIASRARPCCSSARDLRGPCSRDKTHRPADYLRL